MAILQLEDPTGKIEVTLFPASLPMRSRCWDKVIRSSSFVEHSMSAGDNCRSARTRSNAPRSRR